MIGLSKITQKLINKSIWCNTITYIPRTKIVNGLTFSYEEGQSIELKVVISELDKNLIDNDKILPTDLGFMVARLDLSNPTIDDLVIFNEKKYRIILIKEIANLNNTPLGYQFVIRLA